MANKLLNQTTISTLAFTVRMEWTLQYKPSLLMLMNSERRTWLKK